MSKGKSKTAADHLAAFRAKGWSLRTAAPLLGVQWTHLHHVLNGNRESRSLLLRIEALPFRDQTTQPHNQP